MLVPAGDEPGRAEPPAQRDRIPLDLQIRPLAPCFGTQRRGPDDRDVAGLEVGKHGLDNARAEPVVLRLSRDVLKRQHGDRAGAGRGGIPFDRRSDLGPHRGWSRPAEHQDARERDRRHLLTIHLHRSVT